MLIDANTSFGLSATDDTTDYSLDRLLAILDQHSVDYALTCSRRGRDYDFITGNDETVSTCRAHPRLWPVATLDPRRLIGCRDEVRRCADLGCVAFRFFPEAQGWPVVFQPFLDLCENIAEVSLPIILPVGAPGQQTLIGERVASLGVNVLIVGSGYASNAETAAVMARYPNVFAECDVVGTPGTLETLGGYASFEQLVFGSNSPETVFEAPYLMGVHADLTPEQRDGLFAGNVLRFLGREAAP